MAATRHYFMIMTHHLTVRFSPSNILLHRIWPSFFLHLSSVSPVCVQRSCLAQCCTAASLTPPASCGAESAVRRHPASTTTWTNSDRGETHPHLWTVPPVESLCGKNGWSVEMNSQMVCSKLQAFLKPGVTEQTQIQDKWMLHTSVDITPWIVFLPASLKTNANGL